MKQKMILHFALAVSAFTLFSWNFIHAQFSSNTGLGQNYRIYPSTVTQTEPFIVKSPVNSNLLFVSANAISFSPSVFISEGVYVTTNGGMNWYGNDTCTGNPIQFHGGDPGITIDKNGRFILVRRGFGTFPGIYSHYSLDNGITWSAQKTITTHDLERATLTSDDVMSSGSYGRTFSFWVRFAPPYAVHYSYTDDGAVNWSAPVQINNPTIRCQGGDAAIGPNGEVYVCWAGVQSSSPFTEIRTGFAKSLNGGQNWTVTEQAYVTNGIQGTLPQKNNIRVNGYPTIAVDRSNGPRHGWIYIVTNEKNLPPAGTDPDIIMHRSTDGGNSWSAGIRVNQDPLNNGKIQYFPAINIDAAGGVNIIYYDDRNTTSDSAEVFLSRSTNGGDSFTDMQISDHKFKPVPIGGLGQGYQGDNIDITDANNILWPVWMDNSSGIYQIWTVPIDLSSIGITQTGSEIPNDFELQQNFPNPFNPTTKIRFGIPESSNIKLNIYDMSGRLIQQLVNEKLNAGYYEYSFDASQYSSGTYFYRLEGKDFVMTKKMMLVK